MRRLTIAVVGLYVLIHPSLAVGQQVFHDEASFLAAAGQVDVQGFELFPTDSCAQGGASPGTSVDTGLFTVTTVPSDGGSAFLCIGTTNDTDPRPTEGANALIAGSNTGDRWTLTFSFKKPVVAIGFYLTDAAEVGDALFSTDKGHQSVIAECCQPSDPPIFFGFVSNKPFRTFYLTNTGTADGWGVDEVMHATRGKTNQ